jgi:hypothetical protein
MRRKRRGLEAFCVNYTLATNLSNFTKHRGKVSNDITYQPAMLDCHGAFI